MPSTIAGRGRYCKPIQMRASKLEGRTEMAMSWSPFIKPPNLTAHSLRNLAFPAALGSVTLISSISTVSDFSNPIVGRPPQCCINSSSGSSIEADEAASNTVFVKGLPKSTSERNLIKAFSEFGEVSRVKINTDLKTKQSLGFGYVWFSCEEYAQMAVKEMNGKFFEGKFIFVTIAKPGSCMPRAKTKHLKFYNL